MTVFTKSRLKIGAVAVVLGGLFAVAFSGPRVSVSAAEDDKSNLAKFMRKKLNASSLILEGLSVEDQSLIKEGSDAILEMSRSEIWNVLLDEDYREFNRDFRSTMRKLQKAAEEGNFDNALLQWTDAVKGCVECHKYVRAERTKAKK